MKIQNTFKKQLETLNYDELKNFEIIVELFEFLATTKYYKFLHNLNWMELNILKFELNFELKKEKNIETKNIEKYKQFIDDKYVDMKKNAEKIFSKETGEKNEK